MSHQLLSQLKRATISTFEDLGFVLPAPEVDARQASLPLVWSATVGFRGPVSGQLEVRFTDEVAEALAANMLGTDADIDGTVKGDVVSEIANVVCGNVVPALGSSRDVFDLDAPRLSAGSTEDADAEWSVARLELGVEDGRVEVELFVHAGGLVEGGA